MGGLKEGTKIGVLDALGCQDAQLGIACKDSRIRHCRILVRFRPFTVQFYPERWRFERVAYEGEVGFGFGMI